MDVIYGPRVDMQRSAMRERRESTAGLIKHGSDAVNGHGHERGSFFRQSRDSCRDDSEPEAGTLHGNR